MTTELVELAELADDLACLYCPEPKDQNELTRIIKAIRALASRAGGSDGFVLAGYANRHELNGKNDGFLCAKRGPLTEASFFTVPLYTKSDAAPEPVATKEPK